eukprot:CAMPEP_0170142776 /NCGR_PEP_ID=MMETSP0033_2-20121228/8449_1 /TAXON_ID=195969 /ORGANISM="Dolichomastix tenuilepis, Strain CCMP3274" /LENGTH=760 /DNA_ID=CAMNT_0010379149 /DNA_START=11 /DNA_END=2293 /DNA_ORIENTATION=+
MVFASAVPTVVLPLTAVVGIGFAIMQWMTVAKIRVKPTRAGTGEYLLSSEVDEVTRQVGEIQDAITEGSQAFLWTQYKLCAYFMVAFAALLFCLLGSPDGFSSTWKPDASGVERAPKLFNGIFSVLSFLLGASTSILSGYLGMTIATYANARTSLEAQKGLAPAFQCAFRSGAVMGFLLTGAGLLMLYLTICFFTLFFRDDWAGLFEAIAGYGLGGSSIALFGRVGGGIYTKAADVGADLVGKVEAGIPEDDPRNPAVIADNVGDNVGDIAGMGSDLFGSFAESTCAALVISSHSSFGDARDWVAMMYPLMITGISIIVCIIVTLVATDLNPATKESEIESTLKMQLILSCLLMAGASYGITMGSLPATFTGIFTDEPDREVRNIHIFICVLSGLFAGLLIGIVTEYYTSNRYAEVQEVARSCRTGAATNIIFGLALGYKSAIIPVFALAVTIYISYGLASFYGVACAALGMLGTLSTCLAIDAYGPIADNAGGIAEMAGMGDEIRDRTDALDAAGNTTAAIGKGFAIGSAGLVSLALFGAYVKQADIDPAKASLLDVKVYVGVLVGAMLPYWFSAFTMKSVGKAALAMVEEVRRQFNQIPGIMEGTAKPDYRRCVQISTNASLKEMVAPGLLVLLTPPITGILFGKRMLAGVLAGSLVSGIQIAISASNSGGAWDNAKKFIEAGNSEMARAIGGKGSEAHKAAVVGDTVGDPFKDTSGPALNILIKLMAVESLVLAPLFRDYTARGLVFDLLHKIGGGS